MAAIGARVLRSEAPSGRLAILLVACLVAVAVGARLLGAGGVAWAKTLSLVFGSLVISAIPFVAIGAVAAAAISVLVPITVLEGIGRLPRVLRLPAAGLAGVAFPICECGSVPVARRMMLRGLAPSAAVTFMLAAPIVNPVVMASTFVAFRGRGPVLAMVFGRFFLGLLTAMAVGWVLGRRTMPEVLRDAGADDAPRPIALEAPESRWRRFFVHASEDFVFMAKYLLIGATIAAVVQTFLPQRVIGSVAGVPIVDGIALMLFAAILSLCSESDAFIAGSLGQFGFGPASQLAFLVFGPMVDLKLGAMYSGTFSRGATRAIIATSAVVTLVGTMWIRVIIG